VTISHHGSYSCTMSSRATCARLHLEAGRFPLDGSSKGLGTGAITARRTRSGRSLLADPLWVDRGRFGTGSGRHHKRAGLACFRMVSTIRSELKRNTTLPAAHTAGINIVLYARAKPPRSLATITICDCSSNQAFAVVGSRSGDNAIVFRRSISQTIVPYR
jgi:hypothetical protein